MSKGYGPLADRPDRPVVGLEVSHESADLHVTGAALYTEDLVGRTHGTLHAWPVQAPHAHARVTGLRVDGRLRRARRGAGADRRRRARRERRRREARRAAVPQRGHVLRARGLLGARRDPGGGPAGRGPVEADYEPLPALISVHDAIEADSYQGHQRTVSRGDAAAALEAAALPVQRRARDRRPGALLPGDPGRAGAGRRERPDLRAVQHAAPVRDPGHRGPRARPARSPGHRAVPAHGRRLRRQGVPAARAGRHRGARRHAHRAPGEPAAEPHPGHHDDRQAAPVLRHLGGRASTPTSGCARCAPR